MPKPRMDNSVRIRRLYQLEKWKWLLVVGLVTVTHLFCQSLMLPYSNTLLSLIPDHKFIIEEKIAIASDPSSAKSVMVDDPFNVIAPNLVEESLLTRSIKIVDKADFPRDGGDDESSFTKGNGKETEVLSESKGTDNDNGLDFVEDANLDNDIAFEIGGTDDPGIMEKDDQAENITEFKQGFSLEQVVKPGNQVLSDNLSGAIVDKETKDAGAELTAFSSNSSTLSASPNVSILTGAALSISTKGGKAKALFPREGINILQNDVIASHNSSGLVSKPVKKKMKCEMPPKTVTPIHEMERLLVHNRAHSRAMRPRWSSACDQEIVSAKLQIENAPVVRNDQDLYGPLFRNVSTFKKSYELMEQILKIYVYKEGEKPIFHQPILNGLYASEGWFMKLMEGNKRFVVKDPQRAHLFYMPFSSRMLGYKVYVRNSHNRTNLRQFLKDYSDKIAAKYRFWNRTGGADHFLVACHDWAPYETRHHMEHCMKALCNADVTLGFKIGRDVSLPETYVRLAKSPLRDLGGKLPSQRHILAFYAGNMHGYLRTILLEHWKDKDPDMKIFGPMPPSVARKMNYIQHMKSSKYCICPKGYEVNSPRVVEAIFYECVPVIIADNFVPPFFEVLNWNAFALILAEKDIPSLKDILLSIPEEKYRELQFGVRKVQRHFLWHAKPEKYDLFHMILHSIWYNRVFQMKPR